MQPLKERALFFKEALKDIDTVGSVLPSSRSTAKAMTAAFRKRSEPARILEVGAGTGPITARIVKEMRPGDRLDIYEVNPDYTDFLALRFETEDDFQQVKEQCHIYTAGVETIERVPTYDYIISAIPFTAFEADRVEDFFQTYRDLLKPDGVLTYIEFAFGRHILRAFTKPGDPKRQRLEAVGEVVTNYIDQYQVKHKFVLLNAPPARIRSLQFE
ncbi:MAG: methyltransferase domain-containing protein [Anaerolineales bacterium]|nr:methyltransferase domain-containing protein [Anaerolineales bacterium]